MASPPRMDAVRNGNRYFHLDVLEAMGRTSVAFGDGIPAPLLCVTSSAGREGKTHASLALAGQLGDAGEGQVLLVDNALGGKESVTAALAPQATQGWPEMVRGEVDLSQALRRSVMECVDLLPGPPQSDAGGARARLLRDPRYRTLLDGLRGRYRFIVADGPGLSDLPVGREFLGWSDGILVVLEYGRSSAVMARQYLSRLGELREKFLGAVINKRRYPIPRFAYRMF